MLRKVLKALDLDETRWVPREILWFINAQKDEGLRPKHIKDDGDPTRRQLIKIYQAYEEACQRAGVVDFAELLLRAYELWRDNPRLLAALPHALPSRAGGRISGHQRHPIPMADAAGRAGGTAVRGRRRRSVHLSLARRAGRESAPVPPRLIRTPCCTSSNRTTAPRARFSRPPTRSSPTTPAASARTLWTSGEDGERVKLYAAFNERDEADFVVNRIREWVDRGGARREVAVLYRSNAQSRVFEEAFLNARMPYRVYGGLRFFERAEIKDALAYLRLVASRADDTSFERIVNLPTRGIGAKTLDTLRDIARADGRLVVGRSGAGRCRTVCRNGRRWRCRVSCS